MIISLQGALGDCWLLSAMACMAEERCGIESLFHTRELDPRGKYKVRHQTFQMIIIQDLTSKYDIMI